MNHNNTKGTWGIRTLVRVFTVVFGVLSFWLLGFLVEDIESIPGPDYGQIERRHVDQALVQKQEQVEKQIADREREIAGKHEEQRLVGDSSQNLQRTINQLLELQKLSLQQSVSLSDSEKSSLAASLMGFLENQKLYQGLNQNITDLTSKKLQLEEDKRQIEQQITEQKKPAQKEYEKQNESHRLKLALYQLLMLVPLLLVAGFLLLRKRSSLYFPMLLAFGGAVLVKAGFVVHEYFPSRYFKYILIIGLLGVVARLLIHLIRIVAFPKAEWIRRQYRQAYERFLCPVCEFPIHMGPRKFLYWTRRTVHKIFPQADPAAKAEAYTCPCCGTRLFEECPACREIRHSLLGHCEHCGATKETAA